MHTSSFPYLHSHGKMLCHTCWSMLRRQDGKQWRGTYDLHFNHHKYLKDLFRSKKMNCGICRVLFEELEDKHGSELSDVKKDDDRTVNVQAFLFIPTLKENPLYCLNFKFCFDKIHCQRTFVLRETGKLPSLFKIRGLRMEQTLPIHPLSILRSPTEPHPMRCYSAPFSGWLNADVLRETYLRHIQHG